MNVVDVEPETTGVHTRMNLDVSKLNGPRVKSKKSKKPKPINNINRELCDHCEHQIFTHNPIIVCPTCSLIVHNHCVGDANFRIGEGWGGQSKWYCLGCYEKHGIKRYNPFFKVFR